MEQTSQNFYNNGKHVQIRITITEKDEKWTYLPRHRICYHTQFSKHKITAFISPVILFFQHFYAETFSPDMNFSHPKPFPTFWIEIDFKYITIKPCPNYLASAIWILSEDNSYKKTLQKRRSNPPINQTNPPQNITQDKDVQYTKDFPKFQIAEQYIQHRHMIKFRIINPNNQSNPL